MSINKCLDLLTDVELSLIEDMLPVIQAKLTHLKLLRAQYPEIPVHVTDTFPVELMLACAHMRRECDDLAEAIHFHELAKEAS